MILFFFQTHCSSGQPCLVGCQPMFKHMIDTATLTTKHAHHVYTVIKRCIARSQRVFKQASVVLADVNNCSIGQCDHCLTCTLCMTRNKHSQAQTATSTQSHTTAATKEASMTTTAKHILLTGLQRQSEDCATRGASSDV